MFARNQKPFILNFAISVVLIGGLVGTFPIPAGTETIHSSNLQDQAGTLDPAFDGDGKLTTDFSGNTDISQAVMIQPDGKIIAIGSSHNGSDNDFALTRYNSDGSLDTSFDSDGKVTTDFVSDLFGSGYDTAVSGAFQPDGKIVVTGDTSNGFSSNYSFALARYNTDGSLDASFDGDGRVVTNFDTTYVYSDDSDHAYSVVVQPDGKIIAAGVKAGSVSFFALARYNGDGSLDSTFGEGGKVVTDFNASGVAGGDIILQPDGKILLAGSSRRFNNLDLDFALARYNPDGTLDLNFGSGGKVVTDFDLSEDPARAIALQPDGKILIAGSRQKAGISYLALARYNPGGSLDTTFDTDGKLTSDFGGNNAEGTALALQPNGKILLGGFSSNGVDDNFALERYDVGGSLDTTFGTNGRLTTDFGAMDHAFSLAVQQDGKMLLAGFTGSIGGNYDFALARYLGDELRLYLSLASSQTIGGVASADEDILKFDGMSWSLLFDGSDVGVGSPDLFAFTFLDADSLLMSFSSNVTVNGIAATPQDILRFDATSLGSTTSGTWSLYFDGSDVGLADATAEKIDALSLLPDGRLLLSTNGNPAVTGVSGAKDEDVLAFTPASLGSTTAGTWSLYFDGSDVGLSETSGEDIDALDVVGNNVYLSSQDTFSVSGVSGADEDIFVCTAITLGDVTACSYSSSLYFDGSSWGLAANDVDAFHVLASGSLPTPTNTPTPTPTALPGATSTPTATSLPTFTPTATPTATSTGNLVTFLPLADAYVNAGSPTSNYGSSTTLRADASPDLHSYLRFSVQGLSSTVTKATLRVYANSASSLGCTANAVSDNTWTESTLNYNNAPGVGGTLGSSGSFGAGIWIEMDVTPYVSGNGTYNLALTTPSSTAISLASREAGANAPQLIVETSP
jgi:uncharacterized delta-60 repeat protein